MIDHKKAVENAVIFLKEMIPDAENFSIEEIEKSIDKKCWNVTLGFTSKASGEPNPFAGSIFSKKYKQVIVSIDDGSFVGIKSRLTG